MTKISNVIDRSKLKVRRDPYWTKLMSGCYLGYRKMSSLSIGTWSARFFDVDQQKQVRKPLGDFSDYPANERYTHAQNEALKWFKHLGKGGSSEILTIRNICERYVAHLKTEKSEKASKDAALRFTRYVYKNTRLSNTDISKLKPSQLENWKNTLRDTLNTSGLNKGKKRTDSTLNRDMTCLRSALNLAYKDGLVTSDFAWKGKLLPIKNADRKRDTYLDRDQRRLLINSCPPDLAEFVKFSCLIPLRCGAIAGLTVGNYDKKLNTLLVGKDKSGQDRKISLPPNIISFLGDQIKNKHPQAPLLARSNGNFWDKDAWKYPIKDAVKEAKLPKTVTMYTIRHSVITDLIHGGLDTLTVAQLSGTSILMIEKHYGHLTQEHAKEALSRLAI
jgi:integrase